MFSPYSLEVPCRGRHAGYVALCTFGANIVYDWPADDYSGVFLFARLISSGRWHLVVRNADRDTIRIDLTPGSGIVAECGREAWLRWNLRTEERMAQSVLPHFKWRHIRAMVFFGSQLELLIAQQRMATHEEAGANGD